MSQRFAAAKMPSLKDKIQAQAQGDDKARKTRATKAKRVNAVSITKRITKRK
jgi:hypothetical protein